MRRIRIAGLCLVAVFAIGAVSATGASAFGEPPEVGRCLKKAGGDWKDGGCKTPAKVGEEKFEWYPGYKANKHGEEKLIVKPKFTSKSKPETVIQLETTGAGNPGKVKSVVKCTSQTSTGEVTGPKTNVATNVDFKGCESSGLKCKSSKGGEIEGEIKVNDLEGLIGIEKLGETHAKDKVANRYRPIGGGHFVDFACGGIAVEVQGAVLNPVTANAMKLTATVKFVAKGGKQKPEKFVGGVKEVLESKFSNVPGATFEQSGQTLTTVQTNEEKLEISTLE
jgi:hypothetical protein